MACSRPILLLLGSCRCCCISCCFSYRWATPASSAATISQLQDCRCSFAGSTRSLPPPRGDARCRPPRDDTVTQIPHQGVSKVLSSCFFPLRIDTLPTYACAYLKFSMLSTARIRRQGVTVHFCSNNFCSMHRIILPNFLLISRMFNAQFHFQQIFFYISLTI